MNDLLPLATVSLVNFLSAHLPGLSDDWWTKQVVDRLSFRVFPASLHEIPSLAQ